MKKYCIIASTLLTFALAACDKKEQVYAVDAVQEAEAKAIANAPKAEPMKFDDEHLPPLTGTTTTETTDTTTATTDTAAASADDSQAASTTAEAAPATTSEATAETTKTETAPAEAPKQ